MSDDLRTRIACTLHDSTDSLTMSDCMELANAVIRELPELQPCPFCGLSHYAFGCLRTVTLELESAVVAQIKQLVREEIAMWAAASLTAAVDRRDFITRQERTSE